MLEFWGTKLAVSSERESAYHVLGNIHARQGQGRVPSALQGLQV